jgi:hypothetical protein
MIFELVCTVGRSAWRGGMGTLELLLLRLQKLMTMVMLW